MKRSGRARPAPRQRQRGEPGKASAKHTSKKPAPSKVEGRIPGSARHLTRGLHDRVLAAIVESSDAAIIGKTLDGIVTSWNPGAERIFGYAAAEMIGQPIDIIAAPS